MRLRPSLLLLAALATVGAVKVSPPAGGFRKPLKGTGRVSAATPPAPRAGLATHWGVLGVVTVLANAIGRLAPIAYEPLKAGGLGPVQWAAYAGAVAGMAYVEGYKAFQCKFSPLVVSRALTLGPDGGRCTPLRAALAPFYSMGLFHATKKRKIVSWAVSTTVLGVVAAVKRLAYPWRSIVDAGVVAGLSWGLTSLLVIYARALGGTPPRASPELPSQ